MAHQDLGFTFNKTKAGSVIIFHHGKQVTILRGTRAQKAVADLESLSFGEQQQRMARLTGNYKRGNERKARSHLKNK